MVVAEGASVVVMVVMVVVVVSLDVPQLGFGFKGVLCMRRASIARITRVHLGPTVCTHQHLFEGTEGRPFVLLESFRTQGCVLGV